MLPPLVFMPASTLPKSTRQAFHILDQMLTFEDKQAIVSRSESEFITEQHLGLGLWIRNNWIYQDLDNQGLFSKQLKEPGYLVHEDSLSEDFLHRYYQHLKRQNKANQ